MDSDYPAGLSRRELIGRLLSAGCTACLGALASSCPGGSDWGKPRQATAEGGGGDMQAMQDGRMEVPVADVPLNSVKEVSIMGDPAFLVHYEEAGEEKWIALQNKCTHKKSKLDFHDEGFFKCPLHKSEFNLDGSLRAREGGKAWPAKKALLSWAVTLEGGKAVIQLDQAQMEAARKSAAEPREKKDDDDDEHGGRGKDHDDDD